MTMKIELSYFEIKDAIQEYLEKHHGLSVNLDVYDSECQLEDGAMYIDYRERDKVFKKYKNGKVVKNEYGNPVVDWELSKFVKKSISFDDTCDVSFWLKGESDND
tara:strand:- start:323 stop:637 length:315 start_codon:yes stop_codon:yes gene_type:complete